jgi:hypothetical protein
LVSQLFVEIVSEAADFFRLLFTPSALHKDRNTRRQEKYEACKDKKWQETCRQNTWNSFDNSEDEPDWSMVSDALLDALDELNGNMLDALTMFSYWRYEEDHEEVVWDRSGIKYWEAVEVLLKELVVQKGLSTSRHKWKVEHHIIHKLQWFSSRSPEEFHHRAFRLCIPILTPKMLDALERNILARAKAYEEVSVTSLTRFI